ncbi:NmrA domain-containing protein [Mycena sanguinolenta]|uniref:NmrA domain-containing protein n=1 Tax=Mycena sanguinolenta TaxID=230812 RepID=A0A8H6Z939_9AGAR|nr:NmrA domain-containing protein [Mycena sanguinolenta]
MTITQSESSPLVAVVGATGVQGGSVIKALSESDKPYRIRGFTRDSTKAVAETLKKQGVQITQVNLVLDNKEEVFKVFTGADYAFLCTNYLEHMDGERELSEGKMMVDAAKAAGVKGIIWSGLAPVKKITGGKYSKVTHFDCKAQVSEYGRASGIPFVEVQAGFYATNLLGNVPPITKTPDGTYVLPLPVRPTAVMSVIDMEHDFGLYVRRVLELPVFPHGSVVCTTSEDITMEELARQLSQVTGKKVVFKQVTAEEAVNIFVAVGFPSAVATGLVEGLLFHDEFGFYGGQPSASRENLARPTRTFTEFAKGADWSKILA